MAKCCNENFVSVLAVTGHKSLPSIECSTDKGNFDRHKDVVDPMLGLFKTFHGRIKGR